MILKYMGKISPKKKYSLIGIAFLAIAAAFLFSRDRSGANSDVLAVRRVKTITAKEASKNMPLEISGFVRGESRADVAPMASGKILHIFRREGETAKKGEVLAMVDANVPDAQIAAATANADALAKTLDDSKKYYDQLVDQAKDDPNSNSGSVKSAKRARDLQVQAAKNQLVAAQGALSVARASRNNSALVAPFSGTITAVYGREGGFANFSMPLISISTQNSKEIETYVSAADGRNIAIGTIAAMQTSGGQPVSGSVTAVSSGSDAQSLKTLLRIHIDDASGAVLLGDFLHGQILVPRLENALSIPRGAIISRAGDRIVFVLDDNDVAQERIIKIGSEHDGMVDVTEGIEADQKIVIEGQQYLINGSATKPYGSD